jgi:hypothetical protein
MRSSVAQTDTFNDRLLIVDDTEEDATELLTVICDGDPRSNRGFDFDAYRNGGVA